MNIIKKGDLEMSINKVITADEAVAGIEDGMTIMVSGFLGTGSPEILLDLQRDSQQMDLVRHQEELVSF